MKHRLLHITTVPMTLWFLRGQVGFMKERGLDVQVVSSPGDDLVNFGRLAGVSWHAVEMSRRIEPLKDLVAVSKLYRVIRRLRPSIVHAHTPKGGLVGMMAAAMARVPVSIYHIHGLPFVTATGVRRRLLVASERLACALSDQVFCVSQSVAEQAVRAGVCPAGKLRVLCSGSINGVDAAERFNPQRLPVGSRAEVLGRYGIPPGSLVMGYVGRIVRDKGIVELAEAWANLRESVPNLHLMMVGPFEDQDPIPPGVKKDLLSDARVHLVGMDWNTPPLYSAMDVLVLPSYREGLPVVPLEAAAMGLPVVATRIPGCVDAVADGVTGCLVRPRDVAALEEAIRRYLLNPELRRRHGSAGRERMVRDFRQEVIWEAVHGEYRRLLQSTGDSLSTT